MNLSSNDFSQEISLSIVSSILLEIAEKRQEAEGKVRIAARICLLMFDFDTVFLSTIQLPKSDVEESFAPWKQANLDGSPSDLYKVEIW